MAEFTLDAATYRYRYWDTPYMFSRRSFRDGSSIRIEEDASGRRWELGCRREEHVGDPSLRQGAERRRSIVIWRVQGIGGVELPGTGMFLTDLVREFLTMTEARAVAEGARIEVLFG